MKEIQDLCHRYLALQAQRKEIHTRMELVESSLEKVRRDINPDDMYQIATTFYTRLDGVLYCLSFDEEHGSFLSLKQVSDVQIID
jgi:hypothetical protein